MIHSGALHTGLDGSDTCNPKTKEQGMNRREFIRRSALSLAASLLAGCTPATSPQPPAKQPTVALPGPMPLARPTVVPTRILIGPQPVTPIPTAPVSQFVILHTNDSAGYVDPCG